jgi:hypothetical protein
MVAAAMLPITFICRASFLIFLRLPWEYQSRVLAFVRRSKSHLNMDQDD